MEKSNDNEVKLGFDTESITDLQNPKPIVIKEVGMNGDELL